MHNNILDKFQGFLKYLGIDKDVTPKNHEKLLHCFDDEDVNRYWIAFYTAYSLGYKNGRVFEANRNASAIINSIKDI